MGYIRSGAEKYDVHHKRYNLQIFVMSFTGYQDKEVHLVLHPHGIALTLKIGFVVAGGGFYSYYIHQGNISDKEREKLSFMHTKKINEFFNKWLQFRVGAIPRLPDKDICQFLVSSAVPPFLFLVRQSNISVNIIKRNFNIRLVHCGNVP